VDLYEVLGLGSDATVSEIKRAYRRLARRYHPDINPGDRAAEVRFRQILVAFETLSDPDRRSRYDETGSASDPSAAASVGFEGFDFSVEAIVGERASTFGDLFAGVFRREAARPPAQEGGRGADLHADLALTFDEALAGGVRPVMVTRSDRCRVCGGAGVLRGSDAPCLPCGGAGSVRSGRGHMVFSSPCPYCGGAGRQITCDCRACGGEGLEVRSEAIDVRIPPGIADHARLRVAGRGNVGRRGAAAGDLYVTVRVAAHPVFRREGDELHIEVPVAIHEAALGARIEIPTPDGRWRLRVPPGTQSGQRFRLRGRGVPLGTPGARGDLVVELRLVLPQIIDERMKASLREFGEAQTEDVRATLFREAGRPGGAGDAAEVERSS